MEEPFALMLSGGDRRSVGRRDEAVATVLAEPGRVQELVDCLALPDPVIRMRASDALELISQQRPDWIQPYTRLLLEQYGPHPQQEVRWHIAQIVPRLDLTARERDLAVILLRDYLADKSSIVRTFALQGLFDLSQDDLSLRTSLIQLLEEARTTGTPAMKSRDRKLLTQMERTT